MMTILSIQELEDSIYWQMDVTTMETIRPGPGADDDDTWPKQTDLL